MRVQLLQAVESSIRLYTRQGKESESETGCSLLEKIRAPCDLISRFPRVWTLASEPHVEKHALRFMNMKVTLHGDCVLMKDIYSTLQVSPRKRRQPSPDCTPFTPKKLRATSAVSTCDTLQTDLLHRPLTPSSISRSAKAPGASPHANKLPDNLARLCAIHNSLQRAISHALATCAASPTSDSGHLRNVVNHVSLKTYSGLSSSFEIEDLKRLCWLWEWDGSKPECNMENGKEQEDNPFLDEPSPASEDWTRGGMGFLVTSTTHLSKQARKRIPAYGVGIEIEIDIDKGMDSGMAAVARWTSGADSRQKEFKQKIWRWNKVR